MRQERGPRGCWLAEGFSLQGNSRTIEGKRHPDRDGQFRYVSERAKEFAVAGDPVISVDTKKKEPVGQFANRGRSWRPGASQCGSATTTSPTPQQGVAIPYGVYDVSANAGFVNVGTDHDTCAFAVESIRRWWDMIGTERYPGARRLLITCDAGGSNDHRKRAWKAELAALAAQAGLEITVCHFPPGTSKWNKIEHRLFCHITRTWRARPLASHQVIIETIAATTTAAGLTVTAALDISRYPLGAAVSDEQMKDLEDRVITRHAFHGGWNYTLLPVPRPAAPAPPGPARSQPLAGDPGAPRADRHDPRRPRTPWPPRWNCRPPPPASSGSTWPAASPAPGTPAPRPARSPSPPPSPPPSPGSATACPAASSASCSTSTNPPSASPPAASPRSWHQQGITTSQTGPRAPS